MFLSTSLIDDASDAIDAEENNFVDWRDWMGELSEVAAGTAEKLLAQRLATNARLARMAVNLMLWICSVQSNNTSVNLMN